MSAGHRNSKAFITHDGLMGVMEAVHFGVSMIGIPVFGDQQSNIANCVEKGIAIELDHRQVTVQKLIKSIQAIIIDSSNYKPGENVHGDDIVVSMPYVML
ncbi:UDP-glucuronosyl/UDP-glucosyltransferase [Cinara cedri]|uniref:UDP-glucuronosyl/UDP-glucosyltransferase n=1 Tax=Cinara cedri TaxID=506608 RepID=A0A5E4MHW5_9HEMI|nr:UDP-glucuronosyl/UDP-glucosyltransferase [Cinara cedri]